MVTRVWPRSKAQLQQAPALGIRAVPTCVIDGLRAIQGAQPEVFAATLRGLPPAPARDCGPDGCAV